MQEETKDNGGRRESGLSFRVRRWGAIRKLAYMIRGNKINY